MLTASLDDPSKGLHEARLEVSFIRLLAFENVNVHSRCRGPFRVCNASDESKTSGFSNTSNTIISRTSSNIPSSIDNSGVLFLYSPLSVCELLQGPSRRWSRQCRCEAHMNETKDGSGLHRKLSMACAPKGAETPSAVEYD